MARYFRNGISQSLALAGFPKLGREYDRAKEDRTKKLSSFQKDCLEKMLTSIKDMDADEIIEMFSLNYIRNLGDFAYKFNLVKKLIEIVESKGGGYWLKGSAPPLWYAILDTPEPFIDEETYTKYEDENVMRMEVM